MVSNTASNADEVSRWVLDRNELDYIDERHAPGFHVPYANLAAGLSSGIAHNPVLRTTDAVLCDKSGVFEYMEARCAPHLRLLPQDASARAEALRLQHHFLDELWRPVGRLVYRHLLPDRSRCLAIVTQAVPWHERWICSLAYPLWAMAISNGLGLSSWNDETLLSGIDGVLAEVEQQLSDGRPYLVGDALSIADLFFAAHLAPLVLPREFSGAIAHSIDALPESLRDHARRIIDRSSGQFALRIFRDHRPASRAQPDRLPADERFPGRAWAELSGRLSAPPVLRRLYGAAARWLPAIEIAGKVVVCQRKPVLDLLERNQDFTISQVNGPKMAALHVPFFLGMDSSPQHDRERELMANVFRRDDLADIRAFIARESRTIVELQHGIGALDVPASLVRPVIVRWIEDYFGVPARVPTEMMQWLRSGFHDLFLNLSDDAAVHERALRDATAMADHISSVIRGRKQQLVAGEPLPDNLLNRMIRLQAEGTRDWLDDDCLRRNISGVIIGALETTSKSTVLVLDELFRRPSAMRDMCAAAQAEERDSLVAITREALRLNPHNPIVIRHCAREQTLDIAGRATPFVVPAGSTVYAGISPASFDAREMARAHDFMPGRETEYLEFGYGMHKCYGSRMNLVTIPEFLRAVANLPGLRPARGRLGHGGLPSGPFPNNYVIEFDPH